MPWKAVRLGASYCLVLAHLGMPSPCLAEGQSWTGTWTLDRTRAEPDGAAEDYRFTVGPGDALRWEIPSLKEDNVGRLDGTPMRINRPGAPAGETISVWPVSSNVWRYKVSLDGRDRGEGRMTLAADGNSWSDVPLNHGTPVTSLLMVYVRR